MRSSITRLIIFITTILISVIIGFQLHWLSKTYSFEKNEFNTSVIKSIRGLYEDMELFNEPGSQFASLIQHPSENTFLLRINKLPVRDSLLGSLINEFDDFKVYTACKVALYDQRQKKYLYEVYLSSPVTLRPELIPVDAPEIKAEYSYVYLDFPNRNKYVIGNMSNWIVTGVLLLLLLLALGASIYYLFRQKFLNDIQKDFINNVTHEFSTPLTVIELSTDALQKPSIISQIDKYNKYVSSIKYQTDYLKKHIQTLIKTVVTDKYQLVLEKTVVNVNDLIRTAIAQLEPIVSQSNGEIIFEAEDDERTIHADHDNLYLAIFNLVNNALKYSVTPKVIISTKGNGSKYYISIKDNGIGISPADTKKIFRKFYRAQSGNIHNTKGLGLGLYFTKKIIDLHHGQLEVNSVEGIGTEFKIILPVN